MEAKYYTPEFHEFHEGFEYEDGFFCSHFTQRHFSFKDVEGSYRGFFIKAIDNKQIRVKCLTSEDIESFGFIQHFSSTETRQIFNKIVEREIYWIDVFVDFNYITISTNNSMLFHGKIKNKSEFKRILIQTEIIK